MPRKNLKNKMLFGVCSGLADHFNIDVTVIRIIFLIGLIIGGFTLLIYLVLALIMPSEGDNTTYKIDTKSKSWAILIIFIGLLFLLSQLNIFSILGNQVFWGISLIIIGLMILTKKVIIDSNNKLNILSLLLVFLGLMVIIALFRNLLQHLVTILPYPVNQYI